MQAKKLKSSRIPWNVVDALVKWTDTKINKILILNVDSPAKTSLALEPKRSKGFHCDFEGSSYGAILQLPVWQGNYSNIITQQARLVVSLRTTISWFCSLTKFYSWVETHVVNSKWEKLPCANAQQAAITMASKPLAKVYHLVPCKSGIEFLVLTKNYK